MGLIICKIWSKFVSPCITCHHALKSTISKLSAEWTGLIIITHCFMKIKTVIQRKFLAPPEEQFGVPVSILLSRVVADSEPIKYYHRESDSEPMKYYHSESGSPRGRYRGPPINRVLYCQDNSGVGLEGKNLVTAVRQSQNLAGFIGIKQLTITSCLLKKYLAARKRAKQKGTYEIKPTDSQGDQVDAGAAAAFVKFEDNKMAAALLFRSENAWVQLCYQNNELRIESLERPRDFKKDHLFILCPLEQNRYKLQCAFHQESYVIVKEKGAGHCVSLGNSEDESIFELRTEDDNLF